MRNIDILGRKKRKKLREIKASEDQHLTTFENPEGKVESIDRYGNLIKNPDMFEFMTGLSKSPEEIKALQSSGKVMEDWYNPSGGKEGIQGTLPEFEITTESDDTKQAKAEADYAQSPEWNKIKNSGYYKQLTESQQTNLFNSSKPANQANIDKYGYNPEKNNPMAKSAKIQHQSGYGLENPETGETNKTWTQSVKDDIVKPGMTVAGGALATPALLEGIPALWGAANADLLGMGGTSMMDAAGWYGGYQGAKNAPGDIKKFAENPSWSNAGDVGLDVLGAIGGGSSARNLFKGGKELLNKGKGLTSIKTQPATIANLGGKFDDASGGIKPPTFFDKAIATGEELSGKLLHGKRNQKQVSAGNQWLDDWIKHPTTQGKIDADVTKLVKEGDEVQHLLSNSNPAHQAAGHLDEMKHYTPNVSRYSAKGHLKDLFEGKIPVHGAGNRANYGVSYRHRLDGDRSALNRLQQESGYKPHQLHGDKSGRLGTWTSDAFGMGKGKRFSTTVHEGTHDWTTAQRLQASGKQDLINKSINRDHKWRSKNAKEYMEDPAEVHARIMQNRAMANLSPDDVVTDAGVKAMMNMNKELKLVDDGRDDFYNMFKPGQLANLFNKTYVAPAAVGGTGLGVLSGNNNKNQQGVSSQ